jgi:hypothetical protein
MNYEIQEEEKYWEPLEINRYKGGYALLYYYYHYCTIIIIIIIIENYLPSNLKNTGFTIESIHHGTR